MAAVKKSALGRGLGSLMGSSSQPDESHQNPKQQTLPTELLKPNPSQPRRIFNEESLGELAYSIKTLGVLQPILVKKTDGKNYTIVAGERRWRASQIAGLPEVPVRIVEGEDVNIQEMALVENIQREDLNPLEIAMTLSSLIEKYKMTQESIASRLGISRPVVANKLRLLNLPISIQNHLINGNLSEGHCRVLLSLDDETLMEEKANQAVKLNQSVRELENSLATIKYQKTTNQTLTAERKDVRPEEARTLAKTLGIDVLISGTKTKGKLTLSGLKRDDIAKLCQFINDNAENIFKDEQP